MTDWLLSHWLPLDLDFIASTYEALDSFSFLTRFQMSKSPWAHLNWCSSLSNTGVLWLYWGTPKSKRNPDISAHVVSWRQYRGEKWHSDPSGTTAFAPARKYKTQSPGWDGTLKRVKYQRFPNNHLLLLTAGEKKWRLLSLVPRDWPVCWPQGHNVTTSPSIPSDWLCWPGACRAPIYFLYN